MTVAVVRCTDTYDYNDIDVKEEVMAGYAAAALHQANVTCRVFDFKLTDCSIEDVLGFNPKVLVCIVRHPGDNLFYVRRFVRRIRAGRADLPFHITLFGHATVAVDENLSRHHFDSVVLGEEPDLVSLVKQLLSGGTPAGVSGVAYLDSHGKTVRSQPSPPPDLDELPWPTRYYLSEHENPRASASMQTSRGCYARCGFCFLESVKRANGGRYRWRERSLDDVCDEIEHIIATHNVRDFFFYDTDFFGPGRISRSRGQEFAKRVLDRKLDISFFLYTRANDIDDENLEAMKRAGLASVFIGIESFSQPVLDRYRKDSTREKNLNAIELCKKHDIFMHIGYISYDYYTTFAELRDTVSGWKQALSSKPYLIPAPQFLFTLIAPLDGTPIGDEYRNKGIVKKGAKYPFPSWIIADMQMKSPLGSYTFREPKVAEMAECTRLLSYELTVKIVEVHKALANEVESAATDEQLQRSSAQGYVAWLDEVPLFAIDQFEFALNAIDAGRPMYETSDAIFANCRAFYAEYLPEALWNLEIYEDHYLPLRKRAGGFVERNFPKLLELETT